MKILVLSCDKYSSCWSPFFTLLNKYYPNHPEVYLVTETKTCDYCKTINVDATSWVHRFRTALEKIRDKQVLVMLDDFFIREPVDEKRINNIKFDDDTVVYNFELQYRPVKDNYISTDGWGVQYNKQTYLNSCQPSLWDRKKLIERLQNGNLTPQEWEWTVVDSPYKHYINCGKHIINIGHGLHYGQWGIMRGKLTQECIGFLESEGIDTSELRHDFNYHKTLSIITPYYKTLEYTKRLSERLTPQLNDKVEWIIVDDGCNEHELDDLNAIVVHLPINSGGASKPRNMGLKIASGDFICFVDSDDLVMDDYISSILHKIYNDNFDYCFFGWRSPSFTIVGEPPDWNCCVWNTIYKRDIIGDNKFREDLIIAEDYDFNVRVRMGKKATLNKILYYYNDTPNSLMKRSIVNGNN